ncbi:MAG: hypothetical protein HYY68_00555 [Thaumarchaeota archaeon]|nr:hypothetical protein [Nitrososphaerota archaeon]
MTAPRAEKTYEKHAWILLFVVGIGGLAFAFPGLVGITLESQSARNLTGRTYAEIAASDPRMFSLITTIYRDFGLGLLGFSVILMAISAVSYRKGEKWAWYVG